MQVQIRRLPKPVIAMVLPFYFSVVQLALSFKKLYLFNFLEIILMNDNLIGFEIILVGVLVIRLQVMLLEEDIYCTWFAISQLQQTMPFLVKLVLRYLNFTPHYHSNN